MASSSGTLLFGFFFTNSSKSLSLQYYKTKKQVVSDSK